VRRIRLDPRLRPVVTASVTLGLATGVFAISFGVLAVSAGASVAQTCAMSLLVFTGASQLSAVSVIGAGGSLGSALGGALLLAARNGVYGLTMAGRMRGRLATRLLAAHITLDESTAMSSAQEDPEAQRVAFWITGVSIYVFWNIGTLIGALAGDAIDPETFGLDGCVPGGVRRDAVAAAAHAARTRRARARRGDLPRDHPVVPLGVPAAVRDARDRGRGSRRPRAARRRRSPRRRWSVGVTWALVSRSPRRIRVQGRSARRDRRADRAARVARCIALIPAALFAALVVKDTFSTGQHL
jgi:4-azaleucine resistance transporter AzlC